MTTTQPHPTEIETAFQGWVDAQAVTQEHLAITHDGRAERHPDLWMGTMASPCPYMNCAVPLAAAALGAGAAAGAAGDVAARLAAFFSAGEPALVWDRWGTADLAQHGWSLMGHPPFMVRPPVDHIHWSAAGELHIVEVSDARTVADFERTLIEAYPTPELQPIVEGAVFDDRALGGPMRFFVGYHDGLPVATSATTLAAGVNLVGLVSVRSELRGHGFGAAITEAASVADPSLPATLVASDLGRPVYERLGYTAYDRITLWYRS